MEKCSGHSLLWTVDTKQWTVSCVTTFTVLKANRKQSIKAPFSDSQCSRVVLTVTCDNILIPDHSQNLVNCLVIFHKISLKSLQIFLVISLTMKENARHYLSSLVSIMLTVITVNGHAVQQPQCYPQSYNYNAPLTGIHKWPFSFISMVQNMTK